MPGEPWFASGLVCPRDHSPLTFDGKDLVSSTGRRYPVVDGIPVLLRPDVAANHGTTRRTWAAVSEHVQRFRGAKHASGEASAPSTAHLAPGVVHPFAQDALLSTHGNMYQDVELRRYPIPAPRLMRPHGEMCLLDVGCSWGRWSLAASELGYRVYGVDTSLDGVSAARDIAAQRGANVRYAVADARHLPFAPAHFDVVFSYSVLQHFAKRHTREALLEMRRVLRADGIAYVQMLSSSGLRNTFKRARSCGPEQEFDVRYWERDELLQTWTRLMGPTALVVDGFFSANVQLADLELLPRRYRAVVHASEGLRRLARWVPPLVNVADSLYVVSSSDVRRLQSAVERMQR